MKVLGTFCPVQCLCEFLLHEAADGLPVNDLMNDCKQQLGKRKERRHKHQQLVQHLRLLLTDPNQLPEACREVLDYLMRRLSAQKALARHQALTVRVYFHNQRVCLNNYTAP
jgi:integrator complex subunit 1